MTTMHLRTALRGGTAAVTAALALAALGGTAYAFWSSTGTGTGGAQASTAAPVTATALTPSTNLLYPGGTGDLKLTVFNTNPFPVTVTAIAQGAGSVTASGGTGTCTVTGVSLTTQSGLSISVPANGSTVVTRTNAVSMSSASDNGCQNAVFSIPVSITASSS